MDLPLIFLIYLYASPITKQAQVLMNMTENSPKVHQTEDHGL